jgi:hypothetical protein
MHRFDAPNCAARNTDRQSFGVDEFDYPFVGGILIAIQDAAKMP